MREAQKLGDKDKTKKQLLSEVEDLRRRITELEAEGAERRNTEETLIESREKYKDLADLLPQAIFETDESGNLTFVNRIVFEKAGYTPADIEKGLSGLQFVIPEERNRFSQYIKRIMSGEKLGSIETTSLRKDGSTFPAIMYPSLIVKGKKPVGVRGVVVDITDQKQGEEKLRIFSNAVAGAIDGIAITDMKGIITYTNPAMEKTYSYKKGEMLGKPVISLNANAEMANEMMSTMLKKGSWDGEIKTIKKNKETFPALLSLSTVKDARGNPVAMMGAVRDVTDLKQAEEKVQELYHKETALRQGLEAEIEKRIEFTKTLVHELKTPLTPMIASIDILMDEIPDGPLFRLIRSLNKGAETLSKRIDTLLDTAKGEQVRFSE